MSVDKQDFRIYEELFIKHFDELCAYAYTYVSDIDVSKDIVQETFLSLWAKREEYSPSKALLYTGVRNKAIDHLKSAHVKTQAKDVDLEQYIHSLIVDQNSNIHVNDLFNEIQNGISALPEQCRKIFLLSRISHKKNTEIAELLGISVKAVEKQITKAISRIREHLYHIGLLPSLILILFPL